MKGTTFSYTCFLIFLAACSAAPSQLHQDKALTTSSLIAEGASLTLVSDDFKFTEGPAVDAEGNVFFTDQPNDRIMKWSTKGTLSVYMQGTGRANGLYFDHDGNLVACADLNNQLWLINKEKGITVLVNDFEGKKLNGPNDLWIDAAGGIYFTDPFYKREYWARTEKEIEKERVYYLSPAKKDLVIVADDLVQPNGIIGTPDGKKLYIADIGAGKTYAYEINKGGRLSNKALFAAMGSDGMTIDHLGNIYLTNRNGVTVFSKTGEKITQIQVNKDWTANVTFGGKDQKTLFITAMNALYSLEMNVHGVR